MLIVEDAAFLKDDYTVFGLVDDEWTNAVLLLLLFCRTVVVVVVVVAIVVLLLAEYGCHCR